MDTEMEKVYVGLGCDLQDGFKTLQWALDKWKTNSLSIVILHLAYNISEDFVYTPYGKLPASSVSDEKLEVLKKYEQQKLDKLFSNYIAFCGKVKAEIQKIEKTDEAIDKLIVDLINNRKITKFVMSISFLKSSSWRSKTKSAISGSFYIHTYKPSFCEFYIICGGKLVVLNGENEGLLEDDQRVLSFKKSNLRNWIGKWMFAADNSSSRDGPSRDLESPNLRNGTWDDFAVQIEEYFRHLGSLDLDEEINEDDDVDVLRINQSDSATNQHDTPTRMEEVKCKIEEAQKIINLKREEARVNAERCSKAERAIALCTNRVEELEAKIKEEVNSRTEIKQTLDSEREQMQEIRIDVEESQRRLSSLLLLQSELSSKLKTSNFARSNAEKRLENAEAERADLVREIEELSKQRDVLQRRIEFCKEKDAIRSSSKFDELACGYREYTADDIKFATEHFSENLKLNYVDDRAIAYRGRLSNVSVVIVMMNSDNGLSQEAFLAKAKLLTNIRHPHLVAMIGYCVELKCMIFEYMHKGSLRDMLLASQETKGTKTLGWQDRIRIAREVCSALGFIHSAQPKPFIHGHLTVSNVLLNRNLIAKIDGYGLFQSDNLGIDIRAFGMLLIHLLMGRDWMKEEMRVNSACVVNFLDTKVGAWPMELGKELLELAMKCLVESEISVAKIMEELDKIKKKGDDMVAQVRCEMVVNGVGTADGKDSIEIPCIFLCPILKEVMKNPHVAADGFSYELGAIEDWLRTGRDTSPMTNLRLNHKFLTPNNTLRFLIQDWLHNNPDDSATLLLPS